MARATPRNSDGLIATIAGQWGIGGMTLIKIGRLLYNQSEKTKTIPRAVHVPDVPKRWIDDQVGRGHMRTFADEARPTPE